MPRNGPSRQLDAAGQERHPALRIGLDDAGRGRLHQIGQDARAGAGVVDAVRHAEFEIEHADFERIAGLGALDIDRAGEHVHAEPLSAWHLGVDVFGVLQYLFGLDAGAAEIGEGSALVVRP